MYAPFGSHEMSPAGYLVDVKDRYLKCSRLPIIIIDGQYVCGRRMVFGASDVAEATQLIASLIIEGNNASTAIEAPRFQVTLNGTVGIECKKYYIEIYESEFIMCNIFRESPAFI